MDPELRPIPIYEPSATTDRESSEQDVRAWQSWLTERNVPASETD
ncbi:hypothetical protein ABZ413_33395 [Nocardia rhamnosiphila]